VYLSVLVFVLAIVQLADNLTTRYHIPAKLLVTPNVIDFVLYKLNLLDKSE